MRFDQVTKRFGPQNAAVKNLNLVARAGELLVLLGPSGSGKTTALRMIAGLEKPTDGDIYIGDANVTRLAPGARDVAMVFQNYALYPHMNVRENLAYPLKLRRAQAQDTGNRVEEVAGQLGIRELLDRLPRQLSGGQAQRVALGRAIIREPRVFLLDEPLSNLDAKLRLRTRAELQKLHRQLGVTTIYVTHDQEEAMTLGTRIAILKDGELTQVGTPSEIYHRPVNTFVAGFIGRPAMNLIQGHLLRTDSKLALEINGLSWILPSRTLRAAKGSLNPGQRVILGVRPEDILIPEDALESGRSIECSVDLVERIEPEILVYLAIGSATLIAHNYSRVRVKSGQQVNVRFREDRIYLFDAETGDRLTRYEGGDTEL